MKKPAVAIVLFVILLSLSGCGGSPSAPDFAPLRAFSLSVTAQVNGNTFSAALTCDASETLALTFTDPPAFSYVSVRTADDGYVVNVNGVEDVLAGGWLSPGAPLRLLFDTVKTAVFTNHGAFVYEKERDAYNAALTVNGIPVTVSFDREGTIRSLTAPGLTASFDVPC